MASKELSVFFGNINYDVTEEDLRELFGEVGPVIKITMVRDRATGAHKGYGFCQYGDAATAQSAIRNINGRPLKGRDIRVNTASSSGGPSSTSGAGQTYASRQEQEAAQRVNGPTIDEQLKQVIDQLSVHEVYDCVKQMKVLVDERPDDARRILLENPALAQAILMCQWRLGMVRTDPTGKFDVLPEGDPRGKATIHELNGQQKTPVSMPPPPTNPNPYGMPPQPAPTQYMAPRPPIPTPPMPRQPTAHYDMYGRQPLPVGTTPGHPTYGQNTHYPGGTGVLPPRPPSQQNYPPQLIEQALNLTEEQIRTLPPEHRQTLILIRQQYGGQRPPPAHQPQYGQY